MWGLGNHKGRLLALAIAVATMLVVGVLPLRDDVAHGDRLDQDLNIYLPLVMKRYCPGGWQDDFSDPNSGWPTFDIESLKLEYLAGEFHVLTKIPQWGIYFSTLPGIYATNFTLEVDGRDNLGWYGLIFGQRYEGYDTAYEWEGYSFEIEPGGRWGIWKWSMPADGWQALDSGSSPYITSGMNHLKVVRQDSQIEAYVNGYLLSTVTDSSFLGSREVGLTAGALDTAPVNTYFDNFWVCPVDSGPGVDAAGAPGIGKGIILQEGTPPTIEVWPR